jgi:hypothetical protein
VRNESKIKTSVWQWINFFTPYIYAIGIAVIILWMVVSSFQFYHGSHHNEMLLAKPLAKDSWLDVVVKPIVDSEFNRIIFRGFFYLLTWMLLFLIIPVAFLRLKKFKLFNIEFEVEKKEKAALDTAKINATKVNLMSYLSSDDAKSKTMEFLQVNSIDYYEVLRYFLEEIKAGYLKTLNVGFSFELYIQEYPGELIDLVEESKETKQVVICNKIDNDNMFKKNYLVFCYHYKEEELVTVISSRSSQFDIFDSHLLQLLHNVINTYIESVEYIVVLTNPQQQES